MEIYAGYFVKCQISCAIILRTWSIVRNASYNVELLVKYFEERGVSGEILRKNVKFYADYHVERRISCAIVCGTWNFMRNTSQIVQFLAVYFIEREIYCGIFRKTWTLVRNTS